jgi:23S rRNA (guanosine2251-2'-O)-methyltransferase
MDASAERSFLEGSISIEAALDGRSREILRIMVTAGKSRRYRRVVAVAGQRGIPVEEWQPEAIDELAQGKRHGGLLAEVGPRLVRSLADVERRNDSFMIMLDGVEDPYNFGSAVRSLYLAGADGLIVRPRNWLSASSIVARASAGTTELLPVFVAESVEEAVSACRDRGIQPIALDQGGDIRMDELDLRRPLLLIIGGEQRGITRSLKPDTIKFVRIHYVRGSSISLGTAASAAIAGYEVARQRAEGPGSVE